MIEGLSRFTKSEHTPQSAAEAIQDTAQLEDHEAIEAAVERATALTEQLMAFHDQTLRSRMEADAVARELTSELKKMPAHIRQEHGWYHPRQDIEWAQLEDFVDDSES